MWVAEFFDKSTLDEYTDFGSRLFKEVLDKQDQLTKFGIHLDNGDIFSIELTTGKFIVQKIDQGTIEFYGMEEALSNVRVIYFQRECVSFGLSEVNKPIAPTTQFTAIGLQGMDKSGHNRQVYLAVRQDGIFTIHTKA